MVSMIYIGILVTPELISDPNRPVIVIGEKERPPTYLRIPLSDEIVLIPV
jgi:hypothetical protein